MCEKNIIKLKIFRIKLTKILAKFENQEKMHDNLTLASTKCRRCKAKYSTLGNLKRHMLKSHNDNKFLSCHVCSEYFEDYWKLLAHSVEKHSGKMRYFKSV